MESAMERLLADVIQRRVKEAEDETARIVTNKVTREVTERVTREVTQRLGHEKIEALKQSLSITTEQAMDLLQIPPEERGPYRESL